MRPVALHVIQRALEGEQGARDFVEQTTSVYVLDLSTQPKTYGCWNFIHQALNEVERYENAGGDSPVLTSFVPHIRFLCSMALRSARRSLAGDCKLMSTCIDNSPKYHGSDEEKALLIDVNMELREIVMGRIAALAFDLSIHKLSSSEKCLSFSDPVVLDSFCAILSANAVSNGSRAIYHFANEWIVPSAKNIPPQALAGIVLHLAQEGVRQTAPAGSKEVLQRLSVSVVAAVLAPALALSALTNDDEDNYKAKSPSSDTTQKEQLIVKALLALTAWSTATELSLPQIQHICNKYNVDIITILCNVMNSTSSRVLDALADFIDYAVDICDDKTTSKGRMDQARYIIQADETLFYTNFSAAQLRNVECKEMTHIVKRLLSAIEMQDFRFVELQKAGDIDLCRSLTRIAVSTCATWLDIDIENTTEIDNNAQTLLLKAASHPSVHVSGLALPVLAEMTIRTPSLARNILPILQRRAIIPHTVQDGNIVMTTVSSSGVNFHDFTMFRDNELTDCLKACWKVCGNIYFDSCVSAVEEFCSDGASSHVSLHLEAALYCLSTIADEVISCHPFPHVLQMKKCILSISSEPISLMSNPLTLARVSSFLKEYSSWMVETDISTTVFHLFMSIFGAPCFSDPQEGACQDIDEDAWDSLTSQAVTDLRQFLCQKPSAFIAGECVKALHNLWHYGCFSGDSGAIRTSTDCTELTVSMCRVMNELHEYGDRLSMYIDSTKSAIHHIQYYLDSENHEMSVDNEESTLLKSLIVLRTILDEYMTFSSKSVEIKAGGTSINAKPSPDYVLITLVHDNWDCLEQIFDNDYSDEVYDALSSLSILLLPKNYDYQSTIRVFDLMKQISTNAGDTSAGSNSIGVFLQHAIKYLFTETTSPITSGLPLQPAVSKDVMNNFNTLFNMWLHSQNSLCKSSSDEIAGQNKASSLAPQRSLYDVVTTMIATCPDILYQSFDTNNTDYKHFVCQVYDSAIMQLCTPEYCTESQDIEFLSQMIDLSKVNSQSIKYINEHMDRHHGDIIRNLIKRSCGKCSLNVVSDVAALLYKLLQASNKDENSRKVVAAAVDEYGRVLGESCQEMMTYIFTDMGQQRITSDSFTDFVHDVWQFYQTEDIAAISQSDCMSEFLNRYLALLQ